MSGQTLPDYPETLPAAWYHDEAVFQRERQAIFACNWSLIGRLEQVPAPGDYVAGVVAGYPVFVLRGRDGGLKGFHNVCRHRAGPVVRQPAGRCDVLRCAYHGWTYDLEGGLRKAPGFSPGADFDLADYGLLPVRVAQWNRLVFACLDEAAPDLEHWLGDILEIARDFPPLAGMVFAEEDSTEGAANWKTYGDNSVEGYHLASVHKDLTQAVGRETVEIAPYENGQFVGFKVTYDDPGAGGRGRGFWIYKFPGLLLHFSDFAFNLESVIPTVFRLREAGREGAE